MEAQGPGRRPAAGARGGASPHEAHDRRLAERFKAGHKVAEIAAENGMTHEEAQRAITWGLIRSGSITIDQAIRAGLVQPSRPKGGRSMNDRAAA